MPRGSPFTRMCQQLAETRFGPVADLHSHTTASDGDYTPEQLVLEARRANLKFLAVTDHDTVAGIQAATVAAAGSRVTIIPGVEYSAEYQGRELHIVGLGVDPESASLLAALADVQARRRQRFLAYIDAMKTLGVTFAAGYPESMLQAHVSIGRRHLGLMLVRTGQVQTVQEAFQQFILPCRDQVEIHHRTPLRDVCANIHAAGGLALLAHPPSTFGEAEIADLQSYGVDGLEAHFARAEPSRVAELKAIAAKLSIAISGGSDCHGAEPANRRVGTFGLTASAWESLQQHAPRVGSLASV